jgi:hypothetical protein
MGALGQPAVDERCLVGTIVLEDEIDLEIGRRGALIVSTEARNSSDRWRRWRSPITRRWRGRGAAKNGVVPPYAAHL